MRCFNSRGLSPEYSVISTQFGVPAMKPVISRAYCGTSRASVSPKLSSSSTADGSVSRMVSTEDSALNRSSKWTTASAVWAGTGTRLRVSSVITASVPSEPHTSLARLKWGSCG